LYCPIQDVIEELVIIITIKWRLKGGKGDAGWKKAASTYSSQQHLIDENPQSPPVHCSIIWLVADDLHRNIFALSLLIPNSPQLH
jgi:hypothetical protein